MNTDKFASNAIVTDPMSAGFSVQEISDLLFKKYSWRGTTSAQIPYWKEPLHRPLVHAAQIVGQTIPETPPVDFTPLNDTQIAAEFDIDINEIDTFRTTVNGVPSLQIERSSAYPYILRVSKLLLRPIAGNPDYSFQAVTPKTKVNLLAYPIHFGLYNGAYKGTIYRTTGSGEIGNSGNDVIKETQFSYIFDTDNGIFTCYEIDNEQCYSNSVKRTRPPAVTCYIYRGTFGINELNVLSSAVTSLRADEDPPLYGDIVLSAGRNVSLITSTNKIIINGAGSSNTWNDVGSNNGIYYDAGPVLVGTSTIIDPSYALAIDGTCYANTVLTESVYTTSDKHLKENIKSYNNTQNILNISTVVYNYVSKPKVEEVGLIAQDVEQYFPQLVKEFNGFKSVQYDRIGVLLLPIIRNQDKKIRELEENINELKCITYTLLHSLTSSKSSNM
jgi:hypothetical protein